VLHGFIQLFTIPSSHEPVVKIYYTIVEPDSGNFQGKRCREVAVNYNNTRYVLGKKSAVAESQTTHKARYG
jgi:hypothetical protein